MEVVPGILPDTLEKYFISLTLPEGLRVRLARTRDDFLKRPGGLVGRPMNPNKYHITLAVVLKPPNTGRDLWNKITTDLVSAVQQELSVVEGLLDIHQVGKFGDGAVFLEVRDHDDALKRLRSVVVDICNKTAVEVADSTCFHVTLFRNNQIEQLPRLLKDIPSAPVSFSVGVARPESDFYHHCDPTLAVNELFHGKVRGAQPDTPSNI